MGQRICSVEGCEKPHDSHGYCGMHANRVRKYGSPGPAQPRRIHVEERTEFCIIDGCEARSYQQNLCNSHYLRLRRHGSPTSGGRYRKHGATDLERLWTFIAINARGCWIWNGAPTAAGYGWVRAGKESIPAYRWTYEMFVGPIPKGFHVDHVCHNIDIACPGGEDCWHRLCVNPAHLQAITAAENARRIGVRRQIRRKLGE